MSKNKEDILDKLEVQSQGDYFRDDVLKCMEEWGKQEAFLFSEFRRSYKIIEGMNHKHDVTDKIGMATWIGASDEQIWEAYKKGEQLKRWFETENKNDQQ